MILSPTDPHQTAGTPIRRSSSIAKDIELSSIVPSVSQPTPGSAETAKRLLLEQRYVSVCSHCVAMHRTTSTSTSVLERRKAVRVLKLTVTTVGFGGTVTQIRHRFERPGLWTKYRNNVN